MIKLKTVGSVCSDLLGSVCSGQVGSISTGQVGSLSAEFPIKKELTDGNVQLGWGMLNPYLALAPERISFFMGHIRQVKI
jgi:hypothetical protein